MRDVSDISIAEPLGPGGILRGRLDRNAARTTLAVAGELDMSTAPALADRLDELAASCEGGLVLDCADLEFMDSAGLRMLVLRRGELLRAGQELAIRGLAGPPMRVVEITGAQEALGLGPPPRTTEEAGAA
jgi:anti-anti-sigma factor